MLIYRDLNFNQVTMYKFIYEKLPRKILGIKQKKVLFAMEGGLSSSTNLKQDAQQQVNEQTTLPEAKEQKEKQKKETEKQLKLLAEEVDVKINFRKLKPNQIKQYNEYQYEKGAQVKTTSAENLRDSNNPDNITKKLPKNQQMILTGNKKILQKNGEKRIYFEVVGFDKKKKEDFKGYIRGMSLESTRKPKEGTRTFNINTPTTKIEQPEQKNEQPQEETKKTPEVKEVKQLSEKELRQKEWGRLRSKITQRTSYRVKEYEKINTPDKLKYVLDQEQINQEQRSVIEDSMSRFNLTTEHISNLVKHGGMSFNEMIGLTPDNRETEFQEIKKEYSLSSEGQTLNTEINNKKEALEKATNDLDKAKLTEEIKALEDTLDQKSTEYAKQDYKAWMERTYFNGKKYTLQERYIKETDLALKEGRTEEFRVRYEKLQKLQKLVDTLMDLKIQEPKLENLSTDKIENVEVSKSVRDQITSYAKQNAKKLNLTDKQLDNINDIVRDEPLQLLATLMYSEGGINRLSQIGLLTKKDGKISIDTKRFSDVGTVNMKSLVKALSLQEEFGSFGNASPDNLTEAVRFIQKSPNYDKIRQEVYEEHLQMQFLESDSSVVYSHLRRIFDTNYTGKFMENENWFGADYQTQSMADLASGRNTKAESERFDRDYISDRSLYGDIIEEIESNGEISPDKFISKINTLLERGKIAINFDERLSPEQKKKILGEAKDFKLNSKQDLYDAFPSSVIQLIKYGSVYEKLKEDFLANSPKSPAKKFEKAGIPAPDFNNTMSAVSRAIERLDANNGITAGNTGLDAGIGAGISTSKVELGGGWTMQAGVSGGVTISNPSIGAGTALSLENKDKHGSYTITVFANAKFDTQGNFLPVGVGGEVTRKINLGEYSNLDITGGAMVIGGIPILQARIGVNFDNIKEQQDLKFKEGLRNITNAKKLSKKDIEELRSINPSEGITDKQAEKIISALNIEATLNSDPSFTALSAAEQAASKRGMAEVIITRLQNMSVEQAEAVNWGVSVGVVFAGGVPIFVPMISFEVQGKTTIVQAVNLEKTNLKKDKIRDMLKQQIADNPKSESFTFEGQSGYLTLDSNGNSKYVEVSDQDINKIKLSNNSQKLNSLREKTGLYFRESRKQKGKFLVSLDQYKNMAEKARSTETEVYVDPSLSGYVRIGAAKIEGKSGNKDYMGVIFKDGKIPNNLVILRETFTTPSTSGKSTTRVKISFTTRENTFTGSELTNMPGVENKIFFNSKGEREEIEVNNRMERQTKSINDKVSFEESLTTEQLNNLSEASKDLFKVSSVQIEKAQYVPSKEVKELLVKLRSDKAKQNEIAKLTTERKGGKVDMNKVFEIIAGKDNKLDAADKIYILGNLMPDSFRSINSIKPVAERIKRVNNVVKKYVKESIDLLAEKYTKPNGEKFSESELQKITDAFQKNSKITPEIEKSLLKEKVETEELAKDILLGSIVLTTAHRGNIRGLRQMINSKTSPIEIVKGSFRDFKGEEEKIMNEFLLAITDPIENIDTGNINAIKTEQVSTLARSKTALMLLSSKDNINGTDISLASMIFGPEGSQTLLKMYEENFDYSKLSSEEKQTIVKFIELTQKVHQSNERAVNTKNFQGDTITIQPNEISAVVLTGECSNPTLLYNRTLSSTVVSKTNLPTAARAQGSSTISIGGAQRKTWKTPTVGASITGKAKPPPPKRTPKTPPKVPPTTPPETPPSVKKAPAVQVTEPTSNPSNPSEPPKPNVRF